MPSQTNERPNIVVITTHDTGRHFGCYGIPTLNTPAIDRIAEQGVRMSNYFATVPICAASRTSMLTGLSPQTHGQYDLPGFGYEFHDHVKHLSHHMRAGGYQTALVGMQHETSDVNRLAFDYINPIKRPEGGRYTGTEVAHNARQYLETVDRNEPFYLQVGIFETHSPFDFGDAPADHSKGVYVPPYIKPTGPAYELMGQLQGAVNRADQSVDIIDRALHDNGLAENTLLIFTTDHGLELPRAKWYLHDPGIEIGLIARWPSGGITGGRVCDALCSNLDFTPTILDIAGIAGGDELQGASMTELWRGTSDAPIHDHIFAYYSKTDSRCVRTNNEKLIIQAHLGNLPRPPLDICDPSRNTPAPRVMLYDLDNDPLETVNLVNEPEHAQRRDELLDILFRWMESVDDSLLRGAPANPAYAQVMRYYEDWKSQSAATT